MLTVNLSSVIGSAGTPMGRSSATQSGSGTFDAMLADELNNSKPVSGGAPSPADKAKTTSLGVPTPFWLGLPDTGAPTAGQQNSAADDGDGVTFDTRIPPPQTENDTTNAGDGAPTQSDVQDVAVAASPASDGDGAPATNGQPEANNTFALGAPATENSDDGPSGPPDTQKGTEIGIGAPGNDLAGDATAIASEILETAAAVSVSLATQIANGKMLNDLMQRA